MTSSHLCTSTRYQKYVAGKLLMREHALKLLGVSADNEVAEPRFMLTLEALWSPAILTMCERHCPSRT